jgi:hypothetical protein
MILQCNTEHKNIFLHIPGLKIIQSTKLSIKKAKLSRTKEKKQAKINKHKQTNTTNKNERKK